MFQIEAEKAELFQEAAKVMGKIEVAEAVFAETEDEFVQLMEKMQKMTAEDIFCRDDIKMFDGFQEWRKERAEQRKQHQ